MATSDKSMVGAKFELLRSMLGLNVGSRGYVFNQYRDFDNPDAFGVQIIFSNGEFDGFSLNEQSLYLNFLGFDLRYVNYTFVSVSHVVEDFRRGFWRW